MHDYFDVLGVPVTAPVSEIRRATARRVHRAHPDFRVAAQVPSGSGAPRLLDADTGAPDAAIDFLAIGPLVERMESAFFVDGR